jgi:hypothetical protein
MDISPVTGFKKVSSIIRHIWEDSFSQSKI